MRAANASTPTNKKLVRHLIHIISVGVVIGALAWLMWAVFCRAQNYKISPVLGVANAQVPIYQNNGEDASTSEIWAKKRMVGGILSVADDLSTAFGSRPPYDGTKFKRGQVLSKQDAIYVLPFLIACESRDNSVKTLDSNDYYSYGILQFQKATWNAFSKESGITGDPMDKNDAIEMGLWALTNGKLSHWSCAFLLKVIHK